MKRSRKLRLSLALLFACASAMQVARADISVFDLDFRAIPGTITKYGFESMRPVTSPSRNLLTSEGACGLDLGDMANGHMVWNGKTYYVTTQQYQSAAQCAEVDRSIAAHEKGNKILPDGGVCELFLYDEHLELLARQKVRLPDIGGGSWCNGSFALGRASKHMDAILYSLRYYRVNTPRAGSIQAIGTGWIRSTYLFRLRQDADGKPYFEQDDSCLGSPNRYATIADARKALAQCENKKRACD